MEEQDREPEKETERRNELHRVKEKLEKCYKNNKRNNQKQAETYKNEKIHRKSRHNQQVQSNHWASPQ